MIEQVVSTGTSDLIDNVNSHGKLTKAMYDDYISKLDDTNVICNVKLEHKKLALEPEYRFRTAQEIIDEQDKAYTGTNTFHYFPISTELPVVNDNTDNSGLTMNTETNESILAKSIRSAADPSHSHTNGCYVGAHEHGYNAYVPEHTHTDSCYCPGYIKTDVTYDRGGHPIYTCYCSYCYKSYTYGTFTPNQRCKRVICGLTSGQHCNCYEPVVDAYFHTGYIELKCHTCGRSMYTINNVTYGPYVTVSVGTGNGGQYYTYNGASYCEDYSDFYNYLNALPDMMYSASEGCYYVEVPACTILNIPGFGQFKECPVCNDYFVSSDDGIIRLRCMKCNEIIAEFFTASSSPSGYGAWYHKSDGTTDVIYDSAAKDYYNKFSFIFSGSYVSTGRDTISRVLPSAEGSSKFYHEDGFSGTYGDLAMYSPTFSTISADATVINSFPLASYTHHGCTYTYGKNLYCGMEGELKCHEIVKSITPTNPVQIVYVGEPLITTALATYMDGSTGVVLCNADFTASAPVKNKTVTLSYVNIKNKTLTCTEIVTVIPKTKVCVNGHTYNLNADGTDPGCPYCKAWLKSLEFFNPLDGKITIYRGTTLKENGVDRL